MHLLMYNKNEQEKNSNKVLTWWKKMLFDNEIKITFSVICSNKLHGRH